jgi:hypothetical protein
MLLFVGHDYPGAFRSYQDEVRVRDTKSLSSVGADFIWPEGSGPVEVSDGFDQHDVTSKPNSRIWQGLISRCQTSCLSGSGQRAIIGEDRVYLNIEGFGGDPKDYDIRIEYRGLGAGVTITLTFPGVSRKQVSAWENV